MLVRSDYQSFLSSIRDGVDNERVNEPRHVLQKKAILFIKEYIYPQCKLIVLP